MTSPKRQLLAQQFQISRQNDFALLDHIGGKCSGAVTFLEPGQSMTLPAAEGDVEWLGGDGAFALSQVP